MRSWQIIFVINDLQPGSGEFGARLMSHADLTHGKAMGLCVSLVKWEFFLGVGW